MQDNCSVFSLDSPSKCYLSPAFKGEAEGMKIGSLFAVVIITMIIGLCDRRFFEVAFGHVSAALEPLTFLFQSEH